MQGSSGENIHQPFQGRSPGDPMAQLLAAKRRSEEERLLPAFPVTYMNPVHLRMQILLERRNQEISYGDKESEVRTTYIGHEAHFSSASLTTLKPILLKDMRVRHHHKGRFLLCRIIAPPSRIVATAFAVEDPWGWAQIISLYNYPGAHSASFEELDAMFPVDSVVAIREPYPKMALSASHSHIRIDSPTDFIVLEPGEHALSKVDWVTGIRPLPYLTKTANEWKVSGDKHFKEKRYYGSVTCYSFALLRKPSLLAARLNRSLANLRLGRYRDSLKDSEDVLLSKGLSSADQIKALYRCAQAAYGQEEYSSAIQWYSKCLSMDPTVKEAAFGIQRCESRMTEQVTGTYDWYAIFKWGQNPDTEADVADFVGPVANSLMRRKGGGRGIVATRDISVGELLVVSKPFASVNPQSFVSNGLFFGMNFLTEEIQDESRYVLIQKTIERAMANPRDAAKLMDLYAGSAYPPSTIAAESSVSSYAILPTNDIDSRRLQAICSLNVFAGDHHITRGEENLRPKDFHSILYTFPSYLNHSCIPNAEREFVGDVIFIRAVRSIQKGQEVNLSYCGHGLSYEERTKILKKWFPRCDCSLCEKDRDEGDARRRKRKAILTRLNNASSSIENLRKITKEIDATYTSSHVGYRQEAVFARQALVQELDRQASRLLDTGQVNPGFSLLRQSIVEEFQVLEALGIHVINKGTQTIPESRKTTIPISTECIPYQVVVATETCFTITEKFCCIQERKRAEMWMRAAMWIEDKWMGGGLELFKFKWAARLEGIVAVAATILADIEQM